MIDREVFERAYSTKYNVDIHLIRSCRSESLTSSRYTGEHILGNRLDTAWWAWQAAQAHERTQAVKPGEEGWQLREVYFAEVDGDLEIIAYRVPQDGEKLYPHTTSDMGE